MPEHGFFLTCIQEYTVQRKPCSGIFCVVCHLICSHSLSFNQVLEHFKLWKQKLMNDIFKVKNGIVPELTTDVFELVDMPNDNLLNHPNIVVYPLY